MSTIPNFLYLITLFLPGVSFTTESFVRSDGNEEDEETNSSTSATSVIGQYVSLGFVEIDDINGDVTCAPFNPRALDFRVNGTDLDIRGSCSSCNGLLCITHTHLDNLAIYVINPLLGEYLELPPVGIQKKYILFGFGCTSRYSNRYKVLRVVQNQNYDTGFHGEILTVGVDEKWRSFKDASLTMDLNQDGFAMNGVVHFLGEDNGYGFIFAFDVEEERGRHIHLPPGLDDDPAILHLAVWDEKLCFVENYYSETHVNIWTMKEYEDVESWSKETVLTSWVPAEMRPYPSLINPITTLRNRDLLMSNESDDGVLPYLTSYNRMVKMCTKHEVNVDTDDVESDWLAYVPNVMHLMDNLLGGGSQ